jgi:hypothetical protein
MPSPLDQTHGDDNRVLSGVLAARERARYVQNAVRGATNLAICKM